MRVQFSDAIVGVLLSPLFSIAPCLAQPFQVGDRVEASPLAMSTKWESCEVKKILPGGDYGVACGPRHTEYALQGKWVRPISAAPSPVAAPAPVPAEVQAQSTPAARSSTASRASKGSEVCQVGARVTDRNNLSGVVVEAKGADCRVKLDGGATRFYLAWMLRAGEATVQAADSSALAKGRYDCWAAAGVAGTMKLEINGDSSYAGNGKSGSYAYDSKTRKISFQSGPWAGFYGARLDDGKIGISSRPGGFYNTTCDRK